MQIPLCFFNDRKMSPVLGKVCEKLLIIETPFKFREELLTIMQVNWLIWMSRQTFSDKKLCLTKVKLTAVTPEQ